MALCVPTGLDALAPLVQHRLLLPAKSAVGPDYSIHQDGIFTVVTRTTPLPYNNALLGHAARWLRAYRVWRPLLIRYIRLVWNQNPARFVVFVLGKLVSSLLDTLSLWSDTRLESAVEEAARTRIVRRSSLIAYALSHVLSSGFKQRIEGIFTHNEGLLASLFDLEIRQELIAARSRLDLLTLQDPLVTSAFAEANTLNALGAASHLVNLFSHAFNLWSQISLFRSFSRSGRTASTKRLTAFALSAALLQYLRWFIVPPLPERSRPTDPAFQRLSELWNLSCQAEEEAASAELKLLNLDKYLAHQFRLARDQLANVATIRNRGYQTIQTVLDLLSHAWPTFLRCAFILRAVGVHPSVPSGNVSQLAITTMCARKIASTFSSLIASMDDVRLDCTKIRSLYQILDIQPSIKEPEEPALYERVAGPLGQGMKIEFRDVCFSYHGSRGPLALQDVSFTLSPGSLVCVVGGNGAGKSTLIKLLTRLFEPTSGEILVNDRPISAYSTASLHAMMAVQLQHVPRSHLTIAEFIALGRAAQSPKDTIDETAVRQALIKADAMHIVDRLDRGIWSRLGPYPPRATPASILSEAKYYDEQFKDEWAADAPLAPTAATATDASQQTVTAVAVTAAVDTKNCDVAVRAEKRNTTWGLSFSGGEWQKLCFARSLMKDADLRIFDEPAAALDALAAETIFRNIEELRGKQTILHVTHQLRSAVSADLILCLQNGRIVEQGTHHELIYMQDGFYRAMALACMPEILTVERGPICTPSEVGSSDSGFFDVQK